MSYFVALILYLFLTNSLLLVIWLEARNQSNSLKQWIWTKYLAESVTRNSATFFIYYRKAIKVVFLFLSHS